MKKYLILLLGVMIALPALAFNFNYKYQSQTLSYFVLNENQKICTVVNGNTSLAGHVSIPNTAEYIDANGVVHRYSVIDISSGAFSGCKNLGSVTIPNSVTSISNGAFSGCTSMIGLTIPNSVTSIGNSVFQGCTSLLNVTLPNSVTSIGNAAFYGCQSLASVTIPNSVTSIGNGAFYGCQSLTSITIPNSVTSIDEDAFCYCTRLKSVTIPNSVTSINDRTFYDCTNLKSVTIPNSVTSIGIAAFSGCTSLTSVTIPKSVTSINHHAFFGCTSLTSFLVENGNRNFTSQDGVLFDLKKERLIQYPCGKGTQYVIPNSVTSIDNAAFEGCTGLKSVTIPNSVTSIEGAAFAGCSGLTSVTIPNSVTSIGNAAFKGCSGLTSFTIPNSVTSIEDAAFTECKSLRQLKFEDGEKELLLNGDEIFGCPIETLHLGRNLSSFDPSVTPAPFKWLRSLKNLTIGNSVTYIGNEAFYRCQNLMELKFEDGEKELFLGGNEIFDYCPIETLYLGRDCTGSAALSGFGLTSLTIGNSVTKIQAGAFGRCSGLTEVIIPNSVKSIGVEAFKSCTGLTSVILPNSVTSIGESAFYGCYGLKSVILPNSVTSIGVAAFMSCTGLKSVVLPNSIESINKDTFYGCHGLTEVIIPNSVTSIGKSAFYGCRSLKSVIIGNSLTSIERSAFSSSEDQIEMFITAQTCPTSKYRFFETNNVTLYVQGTQTADKYKSTYPWSRFNPIEVMVEPNELRLECDNILTGKQGDTFQLSAKLYPEDVTLPYVFWRSTNPDIAYVDHNGLVTILADINDGNSCKIIAETLYADGPMAEVTVRGEDAGIEDVVENASTEFDSNAPADVYTLTGVCVMRQATPADLTNLAPGLYIVGHRKIHIR